MLGRHIFRVHPAEGRWNVIKDGESAPRAVCASREEAMAQACRFAEAEKPAKVTADDGDGVIVEERLFGSDLSQELGR